jgi:hypothetical protein
MRLGQLGISRSSPFQGHTDCPALRLPHRLGTPAIG